MKVLKDDEEVVITGKELAKHRDICRKEGAIQELEKIINLLDRFGEDRTPTLSIKRHFEKRLKNLESGKE